MSEEKAPTATAEKEQKVAISPEDLNAALDFWRHFNIPIAAGLQTAVEAFTADPSFANQELVTYELCAAITTTDHEAFKDEMFNMIVKECTSKHFEMQFDRDLEAEVTVKE